MTDIRNKAELIKKIQNADKQLEETTKKLLVVQFKHDRYYKRLVDPDKMINLMYDISENIPPYRNYKQPNSVFYLYNSLVDYLKNIRIKDIDEYLIYDIVEEDTLVSMEDSQKYLKHVLETNKKTINTD